MNVQEVQSLFPALENITYLNTATMAVGSIPARRAYEKAVEDWANGKFNWTEAEQAGEVSRNIFASIINASPDEIAIIPAVSTAAGVIAAQLGTAKPNENILVADIEFSSNLFPWLSLKNLGYDVRIVKSIDGMIELDSFAQLADGGTRLIAAGAVQSSNGFRINLNELRQIANRSGAWLFIDACQAAGAVSIDVQRDGIDFLASASHKFLLGSRGMGYLFVRRKLLEQCRPIMPGWKAALKPMESFYGPAMELSSTASKLDTSLAWFAALAEKESLGIFKQIGTEAILEYNKNLSEYLHNKLLDRNSSFKPFPTDNRSTILSVPVENHERIMKLLRESNVVASLRAGRIRLSLHFYNTKEDIDKVVDLITLS
jgi:selenocysteine lyase/cysteine desulfurase